MDRPNPPFAFGQTVFVAGAASHGSVRVPCPICYGQRVVTLILGNGKHQTVQCEACGCGYEGPSGFVQEYRAGSWVNSGQVVGIAWDNRLGAWKTEVSGCYEQNIFATREEAEEARIKMHAEAEEQARSMWESIIDQKKKHHTWSAHYHRKALADLERQADHHRMRLADPRIRERKPKEQTA